MNTNRYLIYTVRCKYRFKTSVFYDEYEETEPMIYTLGKIFQEFPDQFDIEDWAKADKETGNTFEVDLLGFTEVNEKDYYKFFPEKKINDER